MSSHEDGKSTRGLGESGDVPPRALAAARRAVLMQVGGASLHARDVSPAGHRALTTEAVLVRT